MNEFFVDEVKIAKLLDIMVDKNFRIIVSQPFFPIICLFLIKAEINGFIVLIVKIPKGNPMIYYAFEVLFGLSTR